MRTVMEKLLIGLVIYIVFIAFVSRVFQTISESRETLSVGKTPRSDALNVDMQREPLLPLRK